MIYLLVVLLNGVPQPTVYASEQEACVAYQASPGSHVYAISDKRNPSIAEGECKPVQQFLGKK